MNRKNLRKVNKSLENELTEVNITLFDFIDLPSLSFGNFKAVVFFFINSNLFILLFKRFNLLAKGENKLDHSQFIQCAKEKNIFGKEIDEKNILNWLKRNDLGYTFFSFSFWKFFFYFLKKDGDGFLNLDEFLFMMNKMITTNNKSNQDEKEIRKIFDLFDTNKDELIDVNEFNSSLSQLEVNATDEEINFLFNEWDKEKCGVINFQTFSDMIYSFI